MILSCVIPTFRDLLYLTAVYIFVYTISCIELYETLKLLALLLWKYFIYFLDVLVELPNLYDLIICLLDGFWLMVAVPFNL